MWQAFQTAQGLSERTIAERANVTRYLSDFAGVPLLEVTTAQIVAYLARRSLTATSRATYFASIRAFTKWAGRVGLMTGDPTAAVVPTKWVTCG